MNLPFAAPLLAAWARWYARKQPQEPLEQLQLQEVQRVLLVVTTGIGDAIFSSVVFPSVRQALPQADIRLFCREGWRGLFAADPNLNGIIGYAGKFRRLFSTLRTLRAFRPDLTLILHGNDPDIIPLCVLAGSRFTVRIPTSGTAFTDLLANRNRPEDANTLPGLHYVDNRVRILDTVGIPIRTRAPSMTLDADLQQRVSTRLAQHFQGKPYWVLHIHAANPYKSLPLHIARDVVAQALIRFPEFGIVLSGGPENAADLRTLIPLDTTDTANPSHRILVIAGAFSLAESAACLAQARAVVAPDTGILHLAAALDRPVVGLFAPTTPALVGPRAPTAPVITLTQPLTCDPCLQKKCPHRPVLCMEQFSATEILDALAKQLAQPLAD